MECAIYLHSQWSVRYWEWTRVVNNHIDETELVVGMGVCICVNSASKVGIESRDWTRETCVW